MAIWNYESHSIKLNLYYRDLYPNNERIILLLHGLGVDSQSWVFQEKALGEAGYRPIVPDLPGFGSSTAITRKWSIEDCAKTLYIFVHEITNKPIFLLGISLGGAIELKMLSEHPEMYKKAVLVNTFSKIKPEKFSSLLYLVTRLWKVIFLSIEDQAIFMAKRLFPSEADAPYRDLIVNQIVKTDPGVYKQTLFKISTLNLDKYLNSIVTPCLMITGEEDSTILPESQTALAKKLQKCDQIYIRKAGHAVIVQQPDQVNHHILDFITSRKHPIEYNGVKNV
jgi:pimeloyl-ACP methyl ester carboxylesterase